MAYILTPRFAPAYQTPQCVSFGFRAPSSQSTYSCHSAQRSQPQPHSRPLSFASFFSQLEDLVSDIDRESQRQAQIEARREAQYAAQIKAQHAANFEAQRLAHIKAQCAAQIEAQREAYGAYIEAQRAAYHQRQAQINARIEMQREGHRQQEIRQRALNAEFSVTQNEQGWQVDAKVPGFEQDSVSIEVTDENTLKIAGNTEWGAKPQVQATSITNAPTSVEQSAEVTAETTVDEKIEGISFEPVYETSRPGTPASDTSSNRSYQATVEDDFEDLGPEASTLFSAASQPTEEITDKEKAVEPDAENRETIVDPETSLPTATTVTQQPQQDERPHSSFERTFRFPERIDTSSVRASLKEGVLSVIVPRAHVQQIRRIAIL